MMTPEREKEQHVVLTAAHLAYAKGLNAHAFYKLNDHALGEDMVQETFLKTWKYLVKEGKIEIMRAFLYHILNKLIIDEYRKHKNSSLEALLDKGFEPSNDPSDRLINMLDGKAALLLIKHLPANYQSVLKMRYVQSLSLKEMSLITGQTKNALAVRLHRGLEKLKLLYTHQ